MITLTSPFLTSRLIFNLSSINLIIAGKTLALPDQLKTLSILVFGIGFGNCFNSDSSNTSKTTGIFGSFDLILLLKDIGSISDILIITMIRSNFLFEIIFIASAAVDALQTRGA